MNTPELAAAQQRIAELIAERNELTYQLDHAESRHREQRHACLDLKYDLINFLRDLKQDRPFITKDQAGERIKKLLEAPHV